VTLLSWSIYARPLYATPYFAFTVYNIPGAIAYGTEKEFTDSDQRVDATRHGQIIAHAAKKRGAFAKMELRNT